MNATLPGADQTTFGVWLRDVVGHRTQSGVPPPRIKSLMQVPATIAGFERLYAAWHQEVEKIRFSSITDIMNLKSISTNRRQPWTGSSS